MLTARRAAAALPLRRHLTTTAAPAAARRTPSPSIAAAAPRAASAAAARPPSMAAAAAAGPRGASADAAASLPKLTDTQNVLGGPLEGCCTSPMTGWHRDGYCRTGGGDYGLHTVCARVTRPFLDFTASRGNDLETPRPPGFPGLNPGDRWCLCASRWLEAKRAGVAPPVVLASTHARALEVVSLEELKEHAWREDGDGDE